MPVKADQVCRKPGISTWHETHKQTKKAKWETITKNVYKRNIEKVEKGRQLYATKPKLPQKTEAFAKSKFKNARNRKKCPESWGIY